jgi:hypothetical protein
MNKSILNSDVQVITLADIEALANETEEENGDSDSDDEKV